MKENAKLESFHNTVKKQNTLPRLLKCKFVSAEVWLLLFFKPFYLFICLIDSWCAVLQSVLKAYMTLMKDSLSHLASCYRKHMDCCELDKPGTGEFSSMRGTLFSFNHSSCLGGYCGILCPRHIHSKVCRCKYEWIISYYQLMYASLSLNLSSSWIMDTWYVQCVSLSKNKQTKKKCLGQQKSMRFWNQSCSVVMESSALASHALPPPLWFEQHPILRFHHTAPSLSICMSTSTAIYSCTPQATSTGLSLHLFISNKVLFHRNGGNLFQSINHDHSVSHTALGLITFSDEPMPSEGLAWQVIHE